MTLGEIDWTTPKGRRVTEKGVGEGDGESVEGLAENMAGCGVVDEGNGDGEYCCGEGDCCC